jgi:hypothetical protein
LCGPYRGVISRTSLDFSYLWDSKYMNTEVEGSTALEAVTRQRLVKTADYENLVRIVVNCRVCELAIAL